MTPAPFDSVLIANRGEIARRVVKTVRSEGLRAIVVHSTADADLPYVREADAALPIGEPSPAMSYGNVEVLIAAAMRSGAEAVHPGYGFLSENPNFAQAVIDAGMTWVGPSPAVIEAMGNKVTARNRMAAVGVPVFGGSTEPIRTPADAVAVAQAIGYPVMLKAAAGGGGIGMTVVEDRNELEVKAEKLTQRAARLFGNPELLVERFVASARHVEVQVLGLADGTILTMGERDCSIQRRHQKVVEESPALQVPESTRQELARAAALAAKAVGYRNAGTVEFLMDVHSGEFSFLEMNTRLQVEHPVTELVTGVDLVAAQLSVAAGRNVDWIEGTPQPSGHAMEFRLYAEDAERFLPAPGRITEWVEPQGDNVRVDAGYEAGCVVTPFYDPLLAKICVWASDRDAALVAAEEAVSKFVVEGPRTNRDFLLEVIASPTFRANRHDTQTVAKMRPERRRQSV